MTIIKKLIPNVGLLHVLSSITTCSLVCQKQMSCCEMNPTKAFCQRPELVEGEGQFASTKLCPACIKALLKDALPKNCLALGVDLGVCERAKELTKPNAGERSITARHCIFEEVVKIQPCAGSRTGNHKHCVTQGHSVVFSHDASERHLGEAIKQAD
jgi:hypothetical protein